MVRIVSMLSTHVIAVYVGVHTNRLAATGVDEKPLANPNSLTQRDYLIALRNRLFSVEEQIWLHEYALVKPAGKVLPLSTGKYEELLKARDQILDEYPLTKLYTDMTDAQVGYKICLNCCLNRV